MGGFFVPPNPEGGPAAERTYRELRNQAEATTGAVSRERRIEGLLCRRSGRDCLLRVGELDTDNGQTITAIIQVGRNTYTVHHLPTRAGRSASPLVLQQSDVYTITDFQ